MSAAQAARTHFPHFTTECCEHWPTVTICGSMRFYYQMLTVAEELTLDGLIVLMPFVRKEPFMEADVNHPGNVIEKLDAQHKRKIDLGTSIVVVSDDSGYYGDSTRSEIDYAQSHCKTITYRRVALKHTCAGHPSDVCTACRAAKQPGEPGVDRFLGRHQRGRAPATRRGKPA